jgi:hypothetical protein
MNERIQELAVKAKLMAEEDINRQISYNTELKAFAEKFAELIVRECAEVAHCNFHVDGLTLGNIMKEHFGVEE